MQMEENVCVETAVFEIPVIPRYIHISVLETSVHSRRVLESLMINQ